MAIRPTHINDDGSVIVVHDERGHGGTVAAADVVFGKRHDGADLLSELRLACPVPGCGTVSVHPAGGGCDPENVQRLFLHKLTTHPVASPDGKAAPTEAKAREVLRELVEAMDGPGRFRLADAVEAGVPVSTEGR